LLITFRSAGRSRGGSDAAPRDAGRFILFLQNKGARDTVGSSEAAASAIARVIEKCDFVLGEELRLFEEEFARY
jgi:hypothetical protein